MMEKNRRSLLLLHVAVMLFGLSGVLGKWVTVPAYAVAGGRSLCSCLLLLGVLKATKQPIPLHSRRDYGLALVGGVVLAVHWTAFFLSIKQASVAIGTLTFSAFPLFVTFLEPLVFHEKLTRRELLTALVLLCGVAITVPELSLGNRTTEGILWGLLSALTYAVLSLINRDLSRRYSGVQVCFYEQATVAFVLMPVVFLSGLTWTKPDLLGVVAIGIVCTATAFSMFVTAQKHVNARTAGVVSGMETVYGILFAALLLGQLPTLREVLGGAVILGAALYSSLKE
ncbi:MAG: DMT family transporter [Clostridia bacterium]|nr:DMT family transporter [Clostridia bacterium]MBQ3091806.1 DMT family transporter [Clostridia bacterium]